ncbi:Major facilitator superfamily domain containing protein [Lactarius tabidus]
MSRLSPRSEDNHLDEETPFLPQDYASRRPNPLPSVQIALLLSVWLVESIISYSIIPYINQLVRELPVVGGDDRKVGYYTGIIISAHYAAEAVTVLYWNRLSDYLGRKPVLLLCLIGAIVSAIVFGLSRSFWALVFSRALHGSLKGYMGIVTIMMAELTNETNAARGFSMLPVSFSLGYAIGPFIGGMLSRPQDRWPLVFSHSFWVEYPYFLPCFAVAVCGCASLTANAIYLKETVNRGPLTKLHPSGTGSGPAREEPANTSLHAGLAPKDTNRPPPLRAVLTRPVLISIASYAMLALLTKASIALFPLIWSTSVELGGLGLSPASIGLWVSVYGCMSGIVQYVIFTRLMSRFGPRNVVLTSISMCALVYIVFPFENLAHRHASSGPQVVERLLIVLQLSSLGIAEMGFSAIFMYISSAVPNKRLLGAANGLAQTVRSLRKYSFHTLAFYSSLSAHQDRWDELITRRAERKGNELKEDVHVLRGVCLRSFPEFLADLKLAGLGRGGDVNDAISPTDIGGSGCRRTYTDSPGRWELEEGRWRSSKPNQGKPAPGSESRLIEHCACTRRPIVNTLIVSLTTLSRMQRRPAFGTSSFSTNTTYVTSARTSSGHAHPSSILSRPAKETIGSNFRTAKAGYFDSNSSPLVQEKFTRFFDLLEEIRERYLLAPVLGEDGEQRVMLEDEVFKLVVQGFTQKKRLVK